MTTTSEKAGELIEERRLFMLTTCDEDSCRSQPETSRDWRAVFLETSRNLLNANGTVAAQMSIRCSHRSRGSLQYWRSPGCTCRIFTEPAQVSKIRCASCTPCRTTDSNRIPSYMQVICRNNPLPPKSLRANRPSGLLQTREPEGGLPVFGGWKSDISMSSRNGNNPRKSNRSSLVPLGETNFRDRNLWLRCPKQSSLVVPSLNLESAKPVIDRSRTFLRIGNHPRYSSQGTLLDPEISVSDQTSDRKIARGTSVRTSGLTPARNTSGSTQVRPHRSPSNCTRLTSGRYSFMSARWKGILLARHSWIFRVRMR